MGAAYGVMVAVFQHGWGAGLIGTTAPGAIESWIPLFVFVVLFGLSMDYNVFVVSRIKEAHDRGMPTQQAIAHGIRATAGVVTSAAVIMVAVFAVFGTLSLHGFQAAQRGSRGRRAARRDGRARRAAPVRHGPARRPQLVPAALAVQAAQTIAARPVPAASHPRQSQGPRLPPPPRPLATRA